MWTLDEVRGIDLQSPNVLLNQMSPEAREKRTSPSTAAAAPAGRPAPTVYNEASRPDQTGSAFGLIRSAQHRSRTCAT